MTGLMMKRVFITIVSLLLVCVSVKAVCFSALPYFCDHKEKELRKFYDKCANSYNEKNFLKLQDTYQKLIEKYPEDKYLTMLFYGYLNLLQNESTKKEGFNMMKDALSHLSKMSDTSLKDIVAKANANIACCYLGCMGTERDDQQTFTYFQKAFELDSLYAENMAYLYLFGIGTAVDEDRAFSLLHYCYNRVVANIGKPIDFYSFEPKYEADIYEKLYAIQLNKNGVDSIGKENYREGFRHFIIGDYDQARVFYEKAADRGIVSAMYELYRLYLPRYLGKKGEDKKELKRVSNQWLEKAAAANYYPAIYEQGANKFNVEAVFVAQENKAKADAYPYFKQLADIGYGPAIITVNKYETFGWPKEANLLGDIAKGVLTVTAMATSIKNDGWVAGLTSQMHNTGDQYGEINTVDDFIGALQLQNQQFEANKRAQGSASYSSGSVSGNGQYSVDNDASSGYTSTNSNSSSTRGKTNSSSANKGASSNNKTTGSSTRNCRKCGGSGNVKCQRCNGTTRMSCAGCDGRGYNTVVGAGKRKCTICYGKGTQKCTHCNGKGTEKCLGCNGKGQVNN